MVSREEQVGVPQLPNPIKDVGESSTPPFDGIDKGNSLYAVVQQRQRGEAKLARGGTKSTAGGKHCDCYDNPPWESRSSSFLRDSLVEQEIRYMPRPELADILAGEEEARAIVVVDCREDDAKGGKVCGSLHCPANQFGQQDCLRLLGALQRRQMAETPSSDNPKGRGCVVFHCMESVLRGPRCALLFTHYLARHFHKRTEQGGEHKEAKDARLGVGDIDVCVLRGGADQWVRNFWRNPSLVEDFDDNYWGFGFDDESQAGQRGEEA